MRMTRRIVARYLQAANIWKIEGGKVRHWSDEEHKKLFGDTLAAPWSTGYALIEAPTTQEAFKIFAQGLPLRSSWFQFSLYKKDDNVPTASVLKSLHSTSKREYLRNSAPWDKFRYIMQTGDYGAYGVSGYLFFSNNKQQIIDALFEYLYGNRSKQHLKSIQVFEKKKNPHGGPRTRMVEVTQPWDNPKFKWHISPIKSSIQTEMLKGWQADTERGLF